MYKLVVIEDEAIVRKNIIKKVEWGKYGFEVVGEGENGREALEVIENTNPNVVITDIEMPFLNGIELSSIIREKYPNIKIVFLTGFNEFKYAQKAIELDVIEYVLKPVSAESMADILAKIKNKLDEEVSQKKNIEALREHYLRSIPVMRADFLSTLISRKQQNEEILSKAEYYDINLKGNIFAVSAISIDKNTVDEEKFSDEDYELIRFAVLNTAEEILNKYSLGFAFSHDNYIVVISFSLENSREGFLNKLFNALDEIRSNINDYLKFTITIGIGSICTEVSNISESFKSALSALDYRFTIGNNRLIYIEDLEPQNFNKIIFDETKEYMLVSSIIYPPQQQLIYAGLKNENTNFPAERENISYIENYNGEKAVVSVQTEKYTVWRVVGISYYNEMAATKKDVYYFFLIILFISIFIVISVSSLMSARISHPIKKLDRLMKRVEKGEFNIYADLNGEYEVKQLAKTFNMMIRRIRELMNQIIKEQEEKRKSELKALQAQINPHFLYNTLDSIVWMAENNDNKGTITMVTALANLFRISISRGEELISIKDEIEHARSYLIIQKIRYEDKFDYSIEADPEVLKYKSLKIILQPIIENAIYHGIKKMVDKGSIKITANIIDNKICLQVIDNGVGMPPEKVKYILQKESKKKGHSGIGVKNVHERIQLYFGKSFGLEFQSELDEGTCVRVWLPMNE